jgi:tripartite ATP-independent transporter DctM subunit
VSFLTIATPIVLLFVLMAFETPIAFCLAISGTLGILMIRGVHATLATLGSLPFTTTASYSLVLIPLFLFMGLLMSNSQMLDGVFNIAQRLTRRLPGGLGLATVAACTFFGGITGSSTADAATIGRVSVGEMSKRGYNKAYAAALVSAAGTVSILIPPSLPLVMYGIITSESIGSLLLAGFIPGLLTSAIYAVMIVFLSRGRPDRGGRPAVRAAALGAAVPAAEPPEQPIVLGDYFSLLAGGAIFLIVVGGMYLGVFTSVEAGAIAATVALVFTVLYSLWRFRSGRLRFLGRTLGRSLHECGQLVAMMFALVIGASLFSQFLVLARVPSELTAWVTTLHVPGAVVVAMFLLVMVPLGMFVDGLSLLLIVAPISHPIVTELGFGGVWYGVLMVKLIEIALLTPPVGLNVFVVAGLFKDLKSQDVFRQILPFVVAEFITTALLFGFPQIVMFLPDLAAVKG